MDTTSTVFLGLTVGCARCHNHKFDPFTQKEFYQLFAYFNNVPEHGKARRVGNSPPYITAPTARAAGAQLKQLDDELAAANDALAQAAAGAGASAAGMGTIAGHVRRRWHGRPTRGLVAHYPLDGD